MKLLTLNCHSWQEDNQIEKIKHLAKVIVKNNYDIIALQEVSQLQNSKGVDGIIREDNFGYILNKEISKLGEEYSYIWDFSHIGFDIYEEGLAILTKGNIVNNESFYITKATDEEFWQTRKIITATIRVEENELDIYSCHLGWWDNIEEPFKYQADVLMSKLNNNRVSLLMGDFNNSATKIGEGYDYLIENGLIDTFNSAKSKDDGITIYGEIDGWKGSREPLRIDMILSNKKLDVISSKTIFNGDNYQVVSDHYGVEVEVNI